MNNNKPVLKSQRTISVINNGKGSSVPSTFHQMLRAKHGNPEVNRIRSSHRNNCGLFVYLTRHVLADIICQVLTVYLAKINMSNGTEEEHPLNQTHKGKCRTF